jgi:hypothetical protein
VSDIEKRNERSRALKKMMTRKTSMKSKKNLSKQTSKRSKASKASPLSIKKKSLGFDEADIDKFSNFSGKTPKNNEENKRRSTVNSSNYVN